MVATYKEPDVSWFSDKKGIPRTKDEMFFAINEEYVMPKFRNGCTVENMLDYVDLKLEWYTPSIDALKFINFIRLCIGKEPENLNSIAHYFFIDCLFGSDNVKPYFTVRGMDYDVLKKNVLILSTREFSKSVLISYLILYMAATGEKPGFGKVNFGMYVSDRMDGNVVTTMRTIKDLCIGSEYLSKTVFEDTHFTDHACEFWRKPVTRSEIAIYNKHMAQGGKVVEAPQRMDRKFKIQGLGSSGGRGSRSGLDRPEFAIYDDMIANEVDAFSEATLKSIESTIETDVGKSLSGNGHFEIYIGTAYHINDPIYRRATMPGILPVVFPKAEVPPHGDIFDEDGILVAPAITKENFVSVWSDRHSFENQRRDYAIAEEKHKAGDSASLKAINQEFYVRVTSDHERLLKKDWIQWIDLSYIYQSARSYNWYITTDFTTSDSNSANNSVQFLWAVDGHEQWFLMDIFGDKMLPSESYDNVLYLHDKAIKRGANFVDVGVEIDGQQSLHLINLENHAYARNVYITYARQKVIGNKPATWEGIRSKGSGDKLWRLKLVKEQYKNKKVFYNTYIKDYRPEEWGRYEEELSMVTDNEIKAGDDFLDGTSQMALIDIEYPPIVIEERMKYNDRDVTTNGSVCQNSTFKSTSSMMRINDASEVDSYFN